MLHVLLQCRFDEMILIDDKLDNVQSAITLGVHGVWVSGKDAVTWECLDTILSTEDDILKLTGNEMYDE